MAGRPRSLTQMLREADDDSLVELLLARTDLAEPPPVDFSQVAARATTRHSVAEAARTLTRFDLWVARRACAGPAPISAADLGCPGATESDIEQALRRLQRQALMWGDEGALHPVRALKAFVADQGDPEPPPTPHPPDFAAAKRQPSALVDTVAAGSAAEVVRRVEVLVENCDQRPLRLRRDAAVSTREMRDVASLLDAPKAVATGVLEVAQAAALLGQTTVGQTQALAPTEVFDRWQRDSVAKRWHLLAHAWFHHHARSGSRHLKNLCLQAFGDPAHGLVLGKEDVQAWLDWQRPLRPSGTDGVAAIMLEQAAWLGVTGMGALSSFGTIEGTGQLEDLLPDPVDHVLIQGDLTAVAPGPLTWEAAHEIGELADVESRGGATVYRFSERSLRRAHDLGWTSAQIHHTLRTRSVTDLPQPLTYLVGDLDRPRDGVPGAGVGQPDPRPPEPDDARPIRAPVPHRAEVFAVTADTCRAIVAELRASEATPAESAVSSVAAAGGNVFDSPLVALREAVESGEMVWVGFVDTRGVASERVVYADSVADGLLIALDARSQESLRVPVSRMTAAHIIRSNH